MKKRAEEILTQDGISIDRYFLVEDAVFSFSESFQLVVHLIEKNVELEMCVSYLRSLNVPHFEGLGEALAWLEEKKALP